MCMANPIKRHVPRKDLDALSDLNLCCRMMKPGPEVTKLFTLNSSENEIYLAGILTFISIIYTTFESLKA